MQACIAPQKGVWALFVVLLFSSVCSYAQPVANVVRELRYRPDGNDFVITNGTKRFNRALYGGNSAFRVETGDLPEFAMYLPGMGGNLRLGLSDGRNSKWITEARRIEARYQAGTMKYTISDELLGRGVLRLQVLALHDGDGIILKFGGQKIPENIQVFWVFGGATGKRFSRDGDLGADPESSFYLKPEYCADNEYELNPDGFTLYFGSGRDRSSNEIYENNYKPTREELEQTRLQTKKQLVGLCSAKSENRISDARRLENPVACFSADKSANPVVAGKMEFSSGKDFYILIQNPDTRSLPTADELPALFEKTDSARKAIAEKINVETPDPYINAAVSALSTAADAVWDGQSFMHGAIAWRMPLNGWRGAYAADWLGWHDRAETHFNGYFQAQYTTPASGPCVPDTATHLARQKEEIGTALFTEGYISRNPGKINKPHHYDMNLVFIDQLLWHYRWTGDLEYLRKSWPVLERHLAWEKRNFDADNDGLYDAYCCIWASDALQYSGGGVTHSSAYNYRANRMAAELAELIGKDPKPYRQEAEKIKTAVMQQLWLPSKGWFAENKDLLGNKLVHPSAALWTVYHAIDEELADPFQAWQTTRYVDNCIPHIPVRINGMEDRFYTLSTTNWQPYNWSINNVAFGEVLHTALAYWQTGRSDEAFRLTKSTFLDHMFLGSSPGNYGQLSYYDAFRGELYRDFADGIGVASRAVVEGLFGVIPDLFHQSLTVRPGWPAEWPYARLSTSDLSIRFNRNGMKDTYAIETHFPKAVSVKLLVKSKFDAVKSVRVNGKDVSWKMVDTAIEFPELEVTTASGNQFTIEIVWTGNALERMEVNSFFPLGEMLKLKLKSATVVDVFDPQQILKDIRNEGRGLQATFQGELGGRTAFVRLKQGQMQWWQPLSVELRKPVDLVYSKNQLATGLTFSVRNNTGLPIDAVVACGSFQQKIQMAARGESAPVVVDKSFLVPGTNRVHVAVKGTVYSEDLQNWGIVSQPADRYSAVELSAAFNDRVTNIFREQYFSPRSPYPTLAVPIQGIGDWCSFKETEEIDDSGLRSLAGIKNTVTSPQGIPFSVSAHENPNILFTSMWDNYPDSVSLALSGKASHVYLLMAGSGHHMQSRMVNGKVSVEYTDGTREVLELVSPDNWCPIEQDFYEDGFAFKVDKVRPPRLYLKTGEWHMDSYPIWQKNKTAKIAGGAASVLDLPLNPAKELKQMTLETRTNDVVIGLMAATLKR